MPRTTLPAPDPLALIREARGKVAARQASVEAARLELYAHIGQAREAGLSLRVIADAAGVSYETVRRIT